MNNPEYLKIGDKRYKINTDFRVAIECNRISMDSTIGENERGLAIIYKLFGDEGLNNPQDYIELMQGAEKFLRCNKEVTENSNKDADMDFVQDMDYIKASFRSDYQMDLNKEQMHWWEFYNLVCGLSNSEFGNCCVLNRIRNLRNQDPNEIDDPKKRQEVIEMQKQFALKKPIQELSIEQKQNIDNFYKMTGINRKE